MPVTVAATHVDGLVLALTPNSHSYNYRSAVLFGHATLVETDDEKLYAMELITDSVVAGRWQNSRIPPNKAEMSSTSVLKVRIATGSAKIRSGPPGDEKHDMENPAVVSTVWTGVVPVHMSLGAPIAGPRSGSFVEASMTGHSRPPRTQDGRQGKASNVLVCLAIDKATATGDGRSLRNSIAQESTNYRMGVSCCQP
ncbi:hypothetical protein HYQ46_001951 [Verticillium longisporum]|nr:hypothetical protein HYQ46_001951 [Verticillium longisporum]